MSIKPGQFVQRFVDVLRLYPGTGTVLHREFRSAGLISTGPRGRNAPDATTRDAARLTIAVLAAARPSEAVEGYRFYSKLRPHMETLKIEEGSLDIFSFFGLGEDHTLEDVLTAIYGMWGDDALLDEFDSHGNDLLGTAPAIQLTLHESTRNVTLWFHKSILVYHDRAFWQRIRELNEAQDAAERAGDRAAKFRAMEEQNDLFLDWIPGGGLRVERSISGAEISEIAPLLFDGNGGGDA